MGQFTALLYKQWVLTKKQRVSFCCHIFTPMFSLGLIWAIIYVVNHTDLTSSSSNSGDSTYDPDGVIPSYVYAGYSANSETRAVYSDYYNNWSPYRILRYGYQVPFDQTFTNKAYNLVQRTVQGMDVYSYSANQWSPLFNFTDGMSNPQNSNKVLVADLKSVQAIPNNQLNSYQGVADAVMVFNYTTFHTGLNMHLQTNNVASSRLHRVNGVSKIDMVNPQNDSEWISPTVVTEGFIGTMNYLSNKFLETNRLWYQSSRRIQGYVSLTFDSTSLNGLLQNGIAGLSIIFFPVALSMGFPLLLYSLVLESEEKILTLLKINGLNTKVYWLSIYAFYFTLFTSITTIFSVLGWKYIDATFFTAIPKNILTVFFLGWNFSQISFGIFLSTMISASLWANLIGYLTSVLLLLALSGISFTVFPNPSVFPFYFYLLPHSSFIRFFYSMTFDCVSNACPTSFDTMQGDSLRSLIALYSCGLLYTLLAWMAHRVTQFFKARSSAPSEAPQPVGEGVGEQHGGYSIQEPSEGSTRRNELALSNGYPRLLSEGEARFGSEPDFDPRDPRYAVIAMGLTKVYPNGKQALTNFSIKMRKDKVFGLLGPNGAGKTTFLSILSGAVEKTSGEVYFECKPVVYGERNDAKMGFCPQFDILWPNLSVLEHFRFFTMFKGFNPPQGMKKYVRELAADLDLTAARHKRANQLSGGMKRRVSLGCAIAGEPSVIFLDEPSSGLDPVRRREFWDLIKKVGKGKAVVLTTHLMEEADVLSDEIGIMTSGQLRAIGTPNHLKELYGGGFKINVMLVTVTLLDEVESLLNKAFDGACSKTWMFDRSVTFTLAPVGSQKKIMIKVFEIARVLQSKNLIEDWSINQGSLEEVFLRVLERSGQKKFQL